ncbi:MBL fold metallo-hydrolase [Nocardiopsis mangrovi]|uniref:MBL fold metallo-hydrolase n=1 Tax=Nocardiopsis mangrovi TaxID=1179818 RepID=A0ABV9DRN7_9ACTN
MFWKRKGKKKDGGDGDSGAASSTVTTGAAADEEPEAAPDTAEGAARKADDRDGEAPEKPGAAAEAKDEPAEDAADKGEPGTAEGTPSAGTAVDDEAEAADKAEDGTAEPAGADDDGKADAADAADADDDGGVAAAGSDDEADDGVGDPADDDSGEEAVAPEPDVPGTGKVDAEGVQRVRTAGVLTADDEEFDVVSSTWIIDADKEGVIVIDPANDAAAILEAIGDREVYLVACTNGYNTHISAAIEVAARDEAPIALHRRELRAWRRVHGAEHRPDLEIEGGGSLSAGDLEVDILPIPGTSAGSVAYYISERGVVFTGDSLRAGELGTVGGAYIDYTRQLHSIGEVVLSLPPDTRVLPDSGPETTVEAESKNFDSWVAAD